MVPVNAEALLLKSSYTLAFDPLEQKARKLEGALKMTMLYKLQGLRAVHLRTSTFGY